MKDFSSRIVVTREGSSKVIAPSSALSSAIREDELERHVIEHPELLGEELLVLGSQLAESTEDSDRLDVLALDREGELVLVELKVSDAFRVTPDDHEMFKVVLDTSGGRPRFHWRDVSGEVHEMSPSSAWRSIIGAVAPGHPLPSRPYRSVHRRYSTTPGGPSLGEIATTRGLWPRDPGDDDDASA